MGKGETDEMVREANARLKAAMVRVRIEKRGDWLSLRATLPPKPGSLKQKNYEQRIALKIVANAEGLRVAEADAHRLRSALTRGTFRWSDWDDPENGPPENAGDWIERWKAHLFATEQYKNSPNPEKKWQQEQWHCGLSGLVKTEPVTVSNCAQAIMQKKRNSRSQQLAARALGKFAQFCGLDEDFKKFSGSYSSSKVERNTPKSSVVLESAKLFSSPIWQKYYALAAVYGLRPLEVFLGEVVWIELEGSSKILGYSVWEAHPKYPKYRSKTGKRLVPPIDEEWIKIFGIKEGDTLSRVHPKSSSYASRRFLSNKLPFTPYDLRHHYNFYGTMVKGYSSEVMAVFLGHTPTTNRQVYQRGLDSQWALRAYKSTGDR